MGRRINYLRIALLGLALLGALAFTPPGRKAMESLDFRPPVRILFIGNSHTFVNNVPGMFRRLADSAGAKERYDITVHAVGGARFKDHWDNADARALLRQPWDHVILQGASSEPIPQSAQTFHNYATLLANEARKTGARRWFYVTWRRAPTSAWMLENPEINRNMQGWVQAGYRQLSASTGVSLINVGGVWHDVENAEPGFTLYAPDGNHASIHGSYLAALMMFASISGLSPETTSYRPQGISQRDADYLKAMAAGSQSERTALFAGSSASR